MSLRISIFVSCILLFAGSVDAKQRINSCDRIKSQPELWVTAKVDALITSARALYENDLKLTRYQRTLDGINATLRKCKLSDAETFATRYRRFLDYIEVTSLERLEDHELGFNVTDKQYFEETSQFVQIPEFLLAPQFLKSVSRYETLGRAKSYLHLLNSTRAPAEQLIFFSFTSRHLGTPDNDDSFRRLLIVVPGNSSAGTPEKWVQFGVTDPGKRIRVRNVSIVSALSGADGSFTAYFKDYFRTFRRDGSITVKGRWELGYGDDNCAQCHKSGVLPIFPEVGSVSFAEQDELEAVNERFRGYGKANFGKYLAREKFGPGISFASLEDRTRRFGKSFSATTVARSMVCGSCHNAERLGALNWPMDRVLINSYIEGGQMPMGFYLKTAERRELHSKLIEEYFSTDPVNPGILKSWLLSNSD